MIGAGATHTIKHVGDAITIKSIVIVGHCVVDALKVRRIGGEVWVMRPRGGVEAMGNNNRQR